MAVATIDEMAVSSNIQTFDNDYLSALTKLPENHTEEDKFTLINIIEKFKVAMNYLRINDHTKFWSVFKKILENELAFREIVFLISCNPQENVKYNEQEKKSIIWKFGIYNNFRLLLLQELANLITDLYEKAKVFLQVNSFVAKKMIQHANNVSNFYITQIRNLIRPNVSEEVNFLNNCINILENSINIGKESLKI